MTDEVKNEGAILAAIADSLIKQKCHDSVSAHKLMDAIRPFLAAKPASKLFRFPDIHPDPLIAREVVIDCLLGVVAEARGAIVRGLDYSAATPNGISIKNALRNALETTSWEEIESRVYHER